MSQTKSAANTPEKPRANPVKLQQILIAARDLFFRNGYSATSMEAVAKEAGIGKATLYNHFPNKVELLKAVIGTELEIRADLLVFDLAKPGRLRETLAKFAHALIDLLLSSSNVGLYRIISAEAPRHPELGRIFYDNGPARIIDRVASHFALLMEDGRLQHGNARLVASQFIGIIRADMQTRSLFGVYDGVLAADRWMIVENGVDVFLRAYGR